MFTQTQLFSTTPSPTLNFNFDIEAKLSFAPLAIQQATKTN